MAGLTRGYQPTPDELVILRAEYAALLAAQMDLCHTLLELKQRDDPHLTLYDIMLDVNPDAPHVEGHQGRFCLEHLERMMRRFRESDKYCNASGPSIDDQIQEEGIARMVDELRNRVGVERQIEPTTAM